MLLKERGISRRKLAEKAGIPFSTISSAFARRSCGMSVESLSKIAKALDVEFGLLVGADNGAIQKLMHIAPDFEPSNTIRIKVLQDLCKERKRQDAKWGEQNHSPQFWTGILGEEYGELCEAINETVFDNGEMYTKGGYENMRKEAIHVAAVAVSFIECLERNRDEWGL